MSSTTDSDGLGAGLYTELQLGAGGFSWFQYAGIEARYNFTDLSTMRTSMAAQFDGTNYVEIDQAAVTADDCTFLCWFKTSSATTQTLLWVGDKDSNNEYRSLRVSGTQVIASARNATTNVVATESTIDPDDGAKHFAAATFTSDSSRTAHADTNTGTPETTTVTINNTYDRTTIGRLGDASDDPASYLIGEESDAYIFSPALSAAELAYMQANEPTYAELFIAFAAGTTDCPDPANVAAYWPLVEHTLDRTDGSGNDLILSEGGTNPVVGVAGMINRRPRVEDRALAFDGVDQVASSATSDFRIADSTGSIAAWIRTSVVSGQYWSSSNPAVSNRFLTLGLEGTGKPLISQANGGSTQTAVGLSAVDDGNWHLVIWKSNGTNYLISIDGEAFDLGSGDGAWLADVATRSVVNVGRHNTSAVDLFWTGDLANIMYFDSELTDTDASELWDGAAGILARDITATTLTSGEIPIHVWNLSKNNIAGSGEDVGSTGGVDLTLAGTPDPTDTPGIPAGQRNGQVSLVDNAQNPGTVQLTQATLSKRPEVVHVADGSGYGLRFDGVDDYLASAAFSGALAQPNTMFVMADVTDASADQALVDGLGAGQLNRIAVNQTGDLFQVEAGVAADTTLGIDYTNLHLWAVVFKATTTRVWRDGGTADIVSSGINSVAGTTVGMQFDGSTDPASGTYRHLVINDGELTDEEIDEIGAKLALEQGLVWSDIV